MIQPNTRPITQRVVRGGGGGWRYRRICSSTGGGSTARPLPFRGAARPMPLFSVVRMRKKERRRAPRPPYRSTRAGLRLPANRLGGNSGGVGPGLVREVRPEPALDLVERPALARRIVL